jgi:hypothetical protein
MDDDLLDKVFERSVRQYRNLLHENREEIRRDIHKATQHAQEQKKEKIKVGISHSMVISVHNGVVADKISHGIKDTNSVESSIQEPHPELPFGEFDQDED